MSILNDGINAALRLDTSIAMKKHLAFPAEKTAVIIVDAQQGLLGSAPDTLSKYGELIEFSRLHGMQLIYTTFNSQAEASVKAPAYELISKSLAGGTNHEIPAEIKPKNDDTLLKPRTTLSALAGTELLSILQTRGIEHVVVAGPLALTTLDSTVRDLAQEDLHLTLITSCVTDLENKAIQNQLKYTMSRYCHAVIDLKKFCTIAKKSNT